MKQLIWPSIMAKTQPELDQDLNKLKGAAKMLHLDIVDGQFAHNKTFQFPFKLSQHFHYNAHLMVKSPEKWVDQHGKKVDLIIFHPETAPDVSRLIKKIKAMKRKVGLALLPKTKVQSIKPYLNQIGFVLILMVKPGFYGSKFLEKDLKKIAQLKTINPKIKVIVDGGMNPKTIKKARKADFFISGSYTTKADNPQKRINALLQALDRSA
ncbi:MAG TPA: ribulose-phosphate 3-epimerase [Candidatus Nanoarchaeia archaeon]|nr:ribulose-phosphate 3-epimerase [Candidatus Nanoarchaeia archaeon]